MVISDDGAYAVIPDGISPTQAAAASEGAYYAINFLNKVEIDDRKRVLVNGATGAIGSAAVQLLRHHGVEVTATAGTKNVDLVRDLGADRVIDYTKEDFTRSALDPESDREAGEGKGAGGEREPFDYVFDTVGKSSYFKCKPLLRPGGVYISSDLGYLWQNMVLPLTTRIAGRKKVRFPIPTDCRGSVEFAAELMAQGEYSPVIDRTYPFDEIVEAYRYVEKGQKTGNVVISIADR
jgi:NADPH:quinone reductase-like Zn-dependent oxidoreductase